MSAKRPTLPSEFRYDGLLLNIPFAMSSSSSDLAITVAKSHFRQSQFKERFNPTPDIESEGGCCWISRATTADLHRQLKHNEFVFHIR